MWTEAGKANGPADAGSIGTSHMWLLGQCLKQSTCQHHQLDPATKPSTLVLLQCCPLVSLQMHHLHHHGTCSVTRITHSDLFVPLKRGSALLRSAEW